MYWLDLPDYTSTLTIIRMFRALSLDLDWICRFMTLWVFGALHHHVVAGQLTSRLGGWLAGWLSFNMDRCCGLMTVVLGHLVSRDRSTTWLWQLGEGLPYRCAWLAATATATAAAAATATGMPELQILHGMDSRLGQRTQVPNTSTSTSMGWLHEICSLHPTR
jgi:hypothetical protein